MKYQRFPRATSEKSQYHHHTRLAAFTSLFAGLVFYLVFASSSFAANAQVGVVPALPRAAHVLGALPTTQPLQLTMALRSQDPSGLETFATEVSKPGSPHFRQYLNVTEFAQRFGAKPAAITALRETLASRGLTVGPVAANDLTLPVSGSAAAVEKAFSLSLSQVKLATGRIAFENSTAPLLPASVNSTVEGVLGLNSLATEKSQLRSPRPTGAAESGTSPSFSLASTPFHTEAAPSFTGVTACEEVTLAQELGDEGEFRGTSVTVPEVVSAYNLSPLYAAGDTGAGVSVALFEEEAYSEPEVADYQQCYGTSASVKSVNVEGGPGAYPGAGEEAELDIEQVIGLAPQAKILVYQGPTTGATNIPVEIISKFTSENVAKVMSSSYGTCAEETEVSLVTAEHTLLQEAASQGQSFFAGSGDNGSEACSAVNPEEKQLSVLNPAEQGFATAVGGTSLYFEEGEWKQTLWNDLSPELVEYGAGATGGGLAIDFSLPFYQSEASPALHVIQPGDSSGAPCNLPTGYCREIPDVSADADTYSAYMIHAEGGWLPAGGTSAAAPLWAAITALADSSSKCEGVPIGFADPSLYKLASNASEYASDFYDITESSSNAFVSFHAPTNDLYWETPYATGKYPVGAGYDMATGLGAPNGANLVPALCKLAVTKNNEETARLKHEEEAARIQHEREAAGKLAEEEAARIKKAEEIAAVNKKAKEAPATKESQEAARIREAEEEAERRKQKEGLPTKPRNTGLPVIRGKAKVKTKLVVSNGAWQGTLPLTFKYQWSACAKSKHKGNVIWKCKAVRGATKNSFVVSSKYVGQRLEVIVTAANVAGKAAATSKQSSAIGK